jgi:hypothetical protein
LAAGAPDNRLEYRETVLKYAVRIVGLLAILFALYIIVGEQLVGSSSNAYVNTRLATLRMPIDGRIQLSTAPIGGRVSAGEVAGTGVARDTGEENIAWVLDGRLQAAADLKAYEGAADVSELAQRQALERLRAYESARAALRTQQVAGNTVALRSPVSGIVWSLSAHSGDLLPQGEPVARIADCEALFVHATVDQRLYNDLKPGDLAQFRFHNGGVVQVSVSLLAGTGPRTVYETMAVNPTDQQLEGYAVFLEGAGLDSGGTCPIGKSGRVVFSDGPTSWLGDLLAGLGL